MKTSLRFTIYFVIGIGIIFASVIISNYIESIEDKLNEQRIKDGFDYLQQQPSYLAFHERFTNIAEYYDPSYDSIVRVLLIAENSTTYAQFELLLEYNYVNQKMVKLDHFCDTDLDSVDSLSSEDLVKYIQTTDCLDRIPEWSNRPLE